MAATPELVLRLRIVEALKDGGKTLSQLHAELPDIKKTVLRVKCYHLVAMGILSKGDIVSVEVRGVNGVSMSTRSRKMCLTANSAALMQSYMQRLDAIGYPKGYHPRSGAGVN